MDCSLPDSIVYGISQARIPKWYSFFSFSRGSSWPRDRTHVSCIGRKILYQLRHQRTPPITAHMYSIIPGDLFQGISFSRGYSWPRDRTHISCIGRKILYLLRHQKTPPITAHMCSIIHSFKNTYWEPSNCQALSVLATGDTIKLRRIEFQLSGSVKASKKIRGEKKQSISHWVVSISAVHLSTWERHGRSTNLDFFK